MDHRIMRTIQFIETNLARAVSMDELTGCAGLSLSRLSALFKTETGLPPMRYLKEVRLKRASELLRGSGSMEIKDVMVQVGYIDKSQFTKSFKLMFGVPPSQYRHQSVRGRVVSLRSRAKRIQDLKLLSFPTRK